MTTERISPWWYRQRGMVILSVYALGFIAGNYFGGYSPQPVADVLGRRFAGGEGGSVLLWVAVVAALIAWFWRAWGTAYLRRSVVFASDVQSDKLIVAGPFRYVRNPLYVGNMFLALAIAILAPPLGFVIIMLGNAIVVALLASEESKQMAVRYGSTYVAFRAAVPAFWPRLRPADIPGTANPKPSWVAALLGEGYCFALAVAIVPIALFGSAGVPVFWAIWIPGLFIFGAAGWWAGRPQNPGKREIEGP